MLSQIFTISGASETLDPSMEAYYSLLKSHMAGQICTVSYAEYFANS